jgi:ATP-dependent Clp protease protease subunit
MEEKPSESNPTDLSQEPEQNVEESPLLFLEATGTDDFKKIGLYGSIDEERAGEIIYLLLAHQYERNNKKSKESSSDDDNCIEFLISTEGGSASEMFAIYDVMRALRVDLPIGTYGLGKVMSAGVLLLAAGTKGKRKIGKHCRVMLHSVISGHAGELHSLRNELKEVRHTQKQYVEALASETDMTKSHIRRLLNKKVNIYFTAEEAVKLGIADQVV